jgi:hypothetical protein
LAGVVVVVIVGARASSIGRLALTMRLSGEEGFVVVVVLVVLVVVMLGCAGLAPSVACRKATNGLAGGIRSVVVVPSKRVAGQKKRHTPR